jgi:hypothetical protein
LGNSDVQLSALVAYTIAISAVGCTSSLPIGAQATIAAQADQWFTKAEKVHDMG